MVETLTLEPTAPGTFTFKPAYLDAIDARTHKPSRFSANPVRVVVDKASPAQTDPYWQVARFMLPILVAGTLLLAAVALVVTVVRSRRRRLPAVVTVQPAAVAPPPPPRTSAR